jgi:TetR/AcrR family fatty acid metabolism transcriptional regulator
MPIIVDKDKKRREILQAAMQVFARDGYHRAKIESVAEEAGIGKGTVYEYFKSKADLFIALHDHMLTELKSFYMKELAEIREPTLMLERFIEVAFETFRGWEPFFLVFFDFWAEGGRGQAAIITSGVQDGSFRQVDPALTAASLLASLDGLVLQWLCDRNAFDLDLMRKNLTESILRSLRP